MYNTKIYYTIRKYVQLIRIFLRCHVSEENDYVSQFEHFICQFINYIVKTLVFNQES